MPNYEDERWEPGYDPGPSVEDGPWGECESCGEDDVPLLVVRDHYICEPCYEDEQGFDDDDGLHFADPGGNSALRAATPDNPRNLPCPNCGTENVLTPEDRAHGYQCDACADALERGGY